jgi:hypothetical protein
MVRIRRWSVEVMARQDFYVNEYPPLEGERQERGGEGGWETAPQSDIH